MLLIGHITQPRAGHRYIDTLSALLKSGPLVSIDIAVAYATIGGATLLMDCLEQGLGREWTTAKKRFLVGFDYCRTDPEAIEILGPTNTRINDGIEIVKRKVCTPRISFHPKVFAFAGPSRRIVVSGSGNLSRCGLTIGHEVGCFIRVEAPNKADEKTAWATCGAVTAWFRAMWKDATPAGEVINAYEKVYRSTDHRRNPPPTDDDVAGTDKLKSNKHSLAPGQLRKLRVCTHLWIEAGKLTKNRGPNLPGNQLMMSPMSRVFFGFPATDVPAKTSLGSISIDYAGESKSEYTLKFAHNSMDELNLPIPESGGFKSYDSEVLLFTRLSNGKFELIIGGPKDKSVWMARSKEIDADYNMTSGRRWGVW
jgi:hypothetical protein